MNTLLKVDVSKISEIIMALLTCFFLNHMQFKFNASFEVLKIIRRSFNGFQKIYKIIHHHF